MAMAASRVPGSLADLASSAAASTTDARWGDGDGDGVIKRRERTRPMTVLCLGLPRTGTTCTVSPFPPRSLPPLLPPRGTICLLLRAVSMGGFQFSLENGCGKLVLIHPIPSHPACFCVLSLLSPSPLLPFYHLAPFLPHKPPLTSEPVY